MEKPKENKTEQWINQFRPLLHPLKENKTKLNKKSNSDQVIDLPLTEAATLFKNAEQEADQILNIMRNIDISDPTTFPAHAFSIDMLTMMCLIAKIDNGMIDTAIRLFSLRQAEFTKNEKRDALQKLIYGAVKRNPAITQRQLISFLRDQDKLGVITDIKDEAIGFKSNAKEKFCTFDNLKDRLSREKKKLRSIAKKL